MFFGMLHNLQFNRFLHLLARASLLPTARMGKIPIGYRKCAAHEWYIMADIDVVLAKRERERERERERVEEPRTEIAAFFLMARFSLLSEG